MKLVVVIVNYNVKYYLEQCLRSLEKALEGIDAKIMVVDNHSRDGSVEYLRRRFRHIEIIDSNHNLGFARANNVAIRQTDSDYVLLLNPDTFVGEDTIRRAVDFMDAHSEAGGLGVMMHNTDGSVAMESRRGLPSPMVAFYKMCGLCSRFPKSHTFGHYYMGYLDWDSPQRIEVISGAFCLLRRSALDKVGLLDEDFFMYGEDIDLSYRLLKGGYENWYLPQPILHYKGESTVKSSFRYVHVFYQAMLIFFRKHYGHLSYCMSFPIKLAIYVKAMFVLIAMQMDRVHRSLGFSDTRIADPVYIFIGGRQMINRCRTLSRRKGLMAEFYEADETTYSEDNLIDRVKAVAANSRIYYVFDTDTFSYNSILLKMARKRNQRVFVGTFNARSKNIITPNEVIK